MIHFLFLHLEQLACGSLCLRTGRLYELNKSWWSEDRHDPFKSTEAAIGYLKYLYQRFDEDIYLSIAAYNAGPSLVDKRINQNKKKRRRY